MKRILPLLLASMLAQPVLAAERMKEISPGDMTPEQKAILDSIAAGPRGSSSGPFKTWLRSPELADRLQKVGEYVRFHSSLSNRLTEFTILVAGRYWNSEFEWNYHYPLALKAGVPESVLADLSNGKEPAGMTADEALIYRFDAELRRDKTVSDDTYAKAVSRFGERGVIDLIAVQGYYDAVCMTLNVAHVPVPPNSKVPPLAALN